MTNKEKFLKGQTTIKRRKFLDCKVFELKICSNKLNRTQKEHLNRLFLETKWMYNSILSSEDIFKFNHKIKSVQILNKDKKSEKRELKLLPAQVKQELVKRTKTSIKSLSTKKKKGRSDQVGRLKFKSEINSIPLTQYGITYKLHFNTSNIKLAGLKGTLKVKGLNQIKVDKKVKGLNQIKVDKMEIANATLVRKPSGYYLKVTTFSIPKINESKEVVGIDFGIKDDLVLSNGIKFKTKLPVSKGIKLAHRRFSKKIKGSKNHWKAKIRIRKKYEKYNNVKKDATNKIVSHIKNNYSHIGIQDENIKGWHSGLFGKQVQQSILGGIIAKVKKLQSTSIVDRYFPSTKLCNKCGTLNKITLSDRVYRCDCGYSKDRDIHSGMNILIESLNKLIPTGRRDFKPVEFNTSAIEKLKLGLSNSFVSINYEAGRCNSLGLF